MFSFGCHFDLWDKAGSSWLDGVRQSRPGLALEAWSGDLGEIKRWLLSGLIDAALVPEPLVGSGLASSEAFMDRLVLVSTVPRAVQSWDPAYVYVDLGSEYRRQHSLAWPIDETAHMTFGASRWALDYLLDNRRFRLSSMETRRLIGRRRPTPSCRRCSRVHPDIASDLEQGKPEQLSLDYRTLHIPVCLGNAQSAISTKGYKYRNHGALVMSRPGIRMQKTAPSPGRPSQSICQP